MLHQKHHGRFLKLGGGGNKKDMFKTTFIEGDI